ncbi:MAG: phosphoglucosamine mutase [Acidobacteriota bacterium]
MSEARKKRLFGTDGIRGVVGEFPLDGPTVSRIGRALARALPPRARGPRVVIGRDTRESGARLAEALGHGIAAAGGRAVCVGVVPTPGVANLTRTHGFEAGVVISASHNPYLDNGIKVFSAEGFKLPDAQEAAIEEHVLDRDWATEDGPAEPGRLEHDPNLVQDYVQSLRASVDPAVTLSGRKVHLDCANGAAYQIAGELFESLGAEVVSWGTDPNGRNINQDCGALYPHALADRVREDGADFGVAFDGDADRAILVDGRGRVLDGDFILYRAARELQRHGRLRQGCVVATVMSNLWLERSLEKIGVSLRRTDVGDKYVLEEMRRCGANLGGEQSGHIIFLDHSTTGDGLLTALKLAESLALHGARLEQWGDEVQRYPQVLRNLRITSRPDLASHPAIGPVIRAVDERLGERGRVLVRYSGTENLARVMVEGEDQAEIDAAADELCGAIQAAIGAGDPA